MTMKKLKSQLSPYSPEGCFIVTTVYDSQSYKIDLFRSFRDYILIKNRLGALFVKFYYKVSPRIANYIRKRKLVKKFVLYLFIEPVYQMLRLLFR